MPLQSTSYHEVAYLRGLVNVNDRLMFPCVINFIEKRFRCAISRRFVALEGREHGTRIRGGRQQGYLAPWHTHTGTKCIREMNCFTNNRSPKRRKGRPGKDERLGQFREYATVNQHPGSCGGVPFCRRL